MKHNLPKFFFVVILVLIFVELVISNYLANRGKEIDKIEKTMEEVKEANAVLALKIASASSLLAIQQNAKELGFIDSNQASYLTLEEQSVALR